MFCLFVLFINQGQPLKCYLEAATRGALCKKVFLEISQNSRGNACARVSFLIKMQALVFILKKDSGTGLFL